MRLAEPNALIGREVDVDGYGLGEVTAVQRLPGFPTLHSISFDGSGKVQVLLWNGKNNGKRFCFAGGASGSSAGIGYMTMADDNTYEATHGDEDAAQQQASNASN